MRRAIALALCFAIAGCSQGCGGAQNKAVKAAELECLKKIGAELAAQVATAAAAGSAPNKIAIAIELSAEEAACAITALGAQPPPPADKP